MVTRALDVVVLGPPGAGKGTQARRLAGAFDLLHLSSGALLRDEVARGTALGEEAQAVMSRGELVSDELMARIVMSRLHSQRAALGCVYDGYPLTVRQGELLDGLLAELNRRVDAVLAIEVPDEHLITRVSGRRSCPACGAIYHVDTRPPSQDGTCDTCGARLIQREDDREEVFRLRLAVYREAAAPLLDLYHSRGIAQAIDGVGAEDVVFGRLREAMGRSRR